MTANEIDYEALAANPAYLQLFEAPVVAVVYCDGKVYDRCYTWESGQCYALDGYRVEAIADDLYMSKDKAQRLYDADLERWMDCYGQEKAL